MVGKLQYSSTGNLFTYADVGTIRPLNGRDYKVDAVKGKNREDDLEILGYKIKTQITVQNLPANFLDNDKYYFRILSIDESQVIGTDELNYYCIQHHVGTSHKRPISGVDWADYWALGGSDGVAWVGAINYVAVDDIILGQRKYTHNYNALMKIHNIVHHVIGIEFTCTMYDVEDYLFLI